MSASRRRPLGLFQGIGIELEYMIVEAKGLGVLPVSDELIRAVAGSYESEIEAGPLAWSNELVLHVLELKTNGPAQSLGGLAALFQSDVVRINALLRDLGGRLMPGAAHPWMDPHRETRLWPHEYNPVYEAFNRIFDCRGHGWSNLQSTHINLPFAGDDQFGRLHTAIRLVLPLIPALAASSPVVDGRPTGLLDTRVDYYRGNAASIPSVTGAVIPEPVVSSAEYREVILEPIYRDLAPHDPDGVLRHEWANARGAIARFDRDAIEIRLVDVQESPRADMAVAAAIVGLVRALVEERWIPYEDQRRWPTAELDAVLRATTREGEEAALEDGYARALGAPRGAPSAGTLWREVVERVLRAEDPVDRGFRRDLEVILEEGPLARRLLRALGPSPSRAALGRVFGELCDVLEAGELFRRGR